VVYDRENGIIPMTLGQLSDQIHQYDFEWLGVWRDCDFVERRCRFPIDVLVLLTWGASLDVFFYPCFHGRPPGDVRERVQGPVPPCMSS
jgi:hypothetical protein